MKTKVDNESFMYTTSCTHEARKRSKTISSRIYILLAVHTKLDVDRHTDICTYEARSREIYTCLLYEARGR